MNVILILMYCCRCCVTAWKLFKIISDIFGAAFDNKLRNPVLFMSGPPLSSLGHYNNNFSREVERNDILYFYYLMFYVIFSANKIFNAIFSDTFSCWFFLGRAAVLVSIERNTKDQWTDSWCQHRYLLHIGQKLHTGCS